MARGFVRTLISCLSLVAVTAGAGADGGPHTLAVDGGLTWISSEWNAESPAGSRLMHAGEIDGGETAFGASFEYRFTRHVGLRGGLHWGSVPIRTVSFCPAPPVCEYNVGPIFVQISDVTWTVDRESDLRTLFLEVPFVALPNDRFELFAGPTLAHLNLEDVRGSGPDGLAIRLDASTPSYGLHAGGSVLLGWKRNWSVGLIARWLRTDLEVKIDQPVLGAAGRLLSVEDDADATSLTLMVGRRFGGSN